MNKEDLKNYYFSTKELQIIRDKYFVNLKEIVGVENLLNNQSLTDEELMGKQLDICDEIYKFIISDKSISRDFYDAYGLSYAVTMSMLVLESLVADELLVKDRNLDIFLDSESIAYFGEGCPLHIFLWREHGVSIKKFCTEDCRGYDDEDGNPDCELFGLEFMQ